MNHNARPFRGTEALSAGLSPAGHSAPGTDGSFVTSTSAPMSGSHPSPQRKPHGCSRTAKRLSRGRSAAALHGDKWLDHATAAGVDACRSGLPGRHRPPVRARTGWRCASSGVCPSRPPARTAFDLGRRKGRTEALIRLDALANATGLTAADVEPLADPAPWCPWFAAASARDHVDGRWCGIAPGDPNTAGAPRGGPTTATHADPGCDEGGYPFARIDMGYEEFKVGIEYDGEQHWTDPKIAPTTSSAGSNSPSTAG